MQWSKALGSKNYFTIGTDWRWVDGDSLEQVMNGGVHCGHQQPQLPAAHK